MYRCVHQVTASHFPHSSSIVGSCTACMLYTVCHFFSYLYLPPTTVLKTHFEVFTKVSQKILIHRTDSASTPTQYTYYSPHSVIFTSCFHFLFSLPSTSSSQDNDHRVREGSHKALRACAEKLKSGLAPQLRSIIGCWVSGMCDPHGPAATAAKLAFDAAFTSKKQREVMEFGFKSVFKVWQSLLCLT